MIPSGAAYSVQDILDDAQLASLTAVKNKAVYQMPKGIEEWGFARSFRNFRNDVVNKYLA